MKDTTSNALSIKEIMNILLTQEDLTSTDAASNSQYGVDEDTLEALLDRSDLVKAWKEKGGKDKKRDDVNFNANCDEGNCQFHFF